MKTRLQHGNRKSNEIRNTKYEIRDTKYEIRNANFYILPTIYLLTRFFMTEKFDVIIVGAGVTGCSIGYHIKRKYPGSNVLLIDRLNDVGKGNTAGNTAQSGAMFKNIFSSSINRTLADASIDFYLHVQRDLKFDIGLELTGYLWLMSAEQFEHHSKILKKIINDNIPVETINKDRLRVIPELQMTFDEKNEQAKTLELPNIEVGIYGKKCGTLDAEKLVMFYKKNLQEQGAHFQFGTEVESLLLDTCGSTKRKIYNWKKNKYEERESSDIWHESNVRYTGIETSDGKKLTAKKIILATSVWLNELLDPIGIDAHIKAQKRQQFSVQSDKLNTLLNLEGFNEQHRMPIMILPKADIYLRPEVAGNGILLGCSDRLSRDFRVYGIHIETDFFAEPEFYNEQLYPILVQYFPQFENARLKNSTAGFCGYNTIDDNPFVFEKCGVIITGAAGGRGIMIADSIGRIAEALYSKEKSAKLYENRKFLVSKLSVNARAVEKEEFKL